MTLPPLAILIVGIVIVLTLIIALRIHAFIALICAAMVVSLLAPGEAAEKITRVATAFGVTTGKIGIVIAMAAVIGRCLIDSGAADRIVRMFVNLLGEKRCPVSLMSSGFVLSIPVFFDTVFYLLLPLARSMHKQTGKNYLLLILAMGLGASITHSLVPPTPGPLFIASEFNIDIGIMIMIGALLAACTAVVMLFFVGWLSRRINIPMRELPHVTEQTGSKPASLPGLFESSLPIILPVILISSNTIVDALTKKAEPTAWVHHLTPWSAVLGNANMALFLAAVAALTVYWRHRRPTRTAFAKLIEESLASGGMIILITAGGGAFGAMLNAADIGPAIKDLMSPGGNGSIGGIQLLLLAYFVAFLLKFAQGSSTVAMMAASGMLVPLIAEAGDIGFHPVYVACAIGFGAQCGNWMNDSGFWIFAKMSGLTEVETLKTWTVTVSLLAFVGLFFTIIFSQVLPLA